ncbi:CubicO group peptidase (beta-lactamase class C family) [Aquimarina sp. EL_43]|uniref:serine hydrolase n=1 Tax=unclassified Aquimarina TaxID=2627091 RepID=UPI0018CB9D9D|nr:MULTISPECIES: serine hydrolase [unclassified Aquimarina]MBG6129393.1 CubicO group peptidase (beta-lactamase class C family) [Aquimarina sp. EL_35]MBG6150458.1 CubicO group peptidase (beta-lactamase class C family) [Aquimarina sp. EL_32]MBG6168234.1 CubicO group peptidase (beta-lactamase class C family) [Aquimarina sp. EL_43]
MKKLIFLFPVLSFFISCSTTPEAVVAPDHVKLVETNLSHPVYIKGDSTWTIEERMKHYGVPGVSIAIIKDYKIDWIKSYGITDKETKSPVTDQTLFQAGSISKPVAAYGALTLVEQGKIDLDKDVNTYLQSWKLPDSEFTKEKKVALKHLLNHSGGLTVHGFLGYSPDLPVPTLVQVLNGESPANSGAIFVDKTPEKSFRYSGGGYTVMQQMMIDVAQKSFPQLMNDLVLQPLQMSNSTYDQPLQSEQLKMAATGYLPDGSMTKGKRHTYPEMAAAGLWTTAEDLAKFAVNIQQTLKGESKAALSQDMTTKMLTPFVEDFSGLGIFINKMEDEIYFGHGGWDEGFSSEMIAHKDKGYGVVVLTNSNHPDFISELIRSVALSYSWDGFVPTYEKMEMTTTQLEEISGRYRLGNNNLINIYHTNNQLFKKDMGAEPVALFKVSDSTYISRENNQPIQFTTNAESGQLNMLLIHPMKKTVESTLVLMKEDEKIPFEFLEEGNFEEGLKAYQEIMKTNADDPAVSENNLNRLGYRFMGAEKLKLAQDIFKVNMLLYPESFNVYDSYAEACMKIGELDLAIENYKKSYSLNEKNTNALNMIEEIEQKKQNQVE